MENCVPVARHAAVIAELDESRQQLAALHAERSRTRKALQAK
eukprot:gene12184-13805_t